VTWFGDKQTMTILVHPRSGPTGDGTGDGSGEGSDGDGMPGNGGCSAVGGGGAAWPLLVGLLALVGRRRRGAKSRRTR
jgi:uncharacterized protein (TIGR03382 family)